METNNEKHKTVCLCVALLLLFLLVLCVKGCTLEARIKSLEADVRKLSLMLCGRADIPGFLCSEVR